MANQKTILNEETGELEEVNINFIQFYTDNMSLIMQMTKDNSTALRVFLWIVQHMDKRNALVISQQALGEALDLGRTTIYVAIKYLQEKKALAVFKTGNSNIYAINKEICWKDIAEHKKHAKFGATVYMSASEQDLPEFRTTLIGHAERKSKKNINKSTGGDFDRKTA